MTTGHRMRRTGLRVAMGAGLLASLAGVYAFRSLTARPGEGALRFVPADALAVVSIDLSPSASQTVAFKKIDDALARNGFDGMVEKSLIDIFDGGTPGADALRPLTTRSGAVALLPGADGTMKQAKGLALLAVTDGAAAQAALDKFGAVQYYKGAKCYKFKNGKSSYMLEGDTLLVGENPASLYRARQVISGAAPAITADAQFNGARTHVADDANIKLFVSPKLMSSPEMQQASGMMRDWMAVGVAIRDGGIGVSYASLVDLTKQPALAQMGQIPGIRSDLFKVLPAGAYGATVLSQPATYFESVEGKLREDKNVQKEMSEMEESLQKETGMDFRKDVLPAFKGNAVVAAYPASTGAAAGADLLIVLDDSNGADPANATERFRNWVERQMEKEGKQQGPLWTDRQAEGAHFFRISDKVEADLRKSMGEGMDANQINKSALVDSKTVAWAVVGRAVLASTNQQLLDRAVQSYQHGVGGLETDPKFGPIEKDLVDGSQQIMMFSLSRIAEGVKNTVNTSKMDKDGRGIFESVLDAFANLDQPLTIKGKMQSDGRASGGMFIPLDYDKLLDFAGKMKNKK
ncbi:DUF3352 domain-containing protein [Fimbriimonas ginsengisoli]|uniref:DUF3352 domain-containing protein n=1 Tax=Fimbriimonas ginsengisoli Gsoil 348 TaxID=661478 RepID=A0A068NN98_FIMGI|nr:DUF3352 domain-containing protein [Fimbriimonas ginsengisoli]AIE84931.1 hypothetical protein OP10G_1563 [Fimbriimonas ginsengisoli Gsoil 348]